MWGRRSPQFGFLDPGYGSIIDKNSLADVKSNSDEAEVIKS